MAGGGGGAQAGLTGGHALQSERGAGRTRPIAALPAEDRQLFQPVEGRQPPHPAPRPHLFPSRAPPLVPPPSSCPLDAGPALPPGALSVLRRRRHGLPGGGLRQRGAARGSRGGGRGRRGGVGSRVRAVGGNSLPPSLHRPPTTPTPTPTTMICTRVSAGLVRAAAVGSRVRRGLLAPGWVCRPGPGPAAAASPLLFALRRPEARLGLRAAVRAADLPGDPRSDQKLHPVFPQDGVGSH